MQGSRGSSGQSYEEVGLEFQAAARYILDDFYFQLGLSNYSMINQRIAAGRSNYREEERLRYDQFRATSFVVNPLIGMGFKLYNDWKLQVNYLPPLINSGRSNWQIGLVYMINKHRRTEESLRKQRRQIAYKQIKQLRNGALLFRLKTARPTIEALESKGFARRAEEVRKAQAEENREIMQAFRKKYHFSEIKFFYSHHSRNVREGRYEGIFVNDGLEEDSSIVLHNRKHVFMAELAQLEDDTTKFFSHYEMVPTGNFAAVQVPRFYGGTGINFYAFVIKNPDFYQLQKPFPYYSRALFKSLKEHPGHGFFYLPLKLFNETTAIGSVEDLNWKLYHFYEKVKRKEE
jgi:hypothetical protein